MWVQLRAQRERVEDLVDEVVQSYHNGFNKAIHNYSRILRLFSESKDQVSLQSCASLHTVPMTMRESLGWGVMLGVQLRKALMHP